MGETNKTTLHFDIDANDFSVAGQASAAVKRTLKKLGFGAEVIRKVAIAMYEGEINMVIHANGGVIDVEISPRQVVCILADKGPGIPDVSLAMQEGYSTASQDVRELGFGAGMGLPNIKKYTDDLKIETVIGKGTTLTMTINNQ